MQVIACVTESAAIRDILTCIGEPTAPPMLDPPRFSDAVDLATVARQVGHSNVLTMRRVATRSAISTRHASTHRTPGVTTARYDRRDQKTQQRGVLRLDVPFGPR